MDKKKPSRVLGAGVEYGRARKEHKIVLPNPKLREKYSEKSNAISSGADIHRSHPPKRAPGTYRSKARPVLRLYVSIRECGTLPLSLPKLPIRKRIFQVGLHHYHWLLATSSERSAQIPPSTHGNVSLRPEIQAPQLTTWGSTRRGENAA